MGRCLIVQTVIKKFKKIDEDIPCVQKINEVIDCLKILDIETFQVSLSNLFFMGEEFTDLDMSLLRENLSVFYCYLSLWSSMFHFAWNLHEKYSTYLNSTAQALKIILEYDYMESKDDEKDDQETQDDGK